MVNKESRGNYTFSICLNLIIILFGANLLSCNAPDAFPIVPKIGFDKVVFKDLTDAPD